MNMQFSLIREPVLYALELGLNDEKTTKNICCTAKGDC